MKQRRGIAPRSRARSPEQALSETAQWTFWCAVWLAGLQALVLASLVHEGHVSSARAVIALIGAPASAYMAWRAWCAPGVVTSAAVLGFSVVQTALGLLPVTALEVASDPVGRLVNWADLSPALLVVGAAVGLYASWRLAEHRRRAQARRLAI